MDFSHEGISASVLHNPFSVIGESRRTIFFKSHHVGHHHHIRILAQCFFQISQFVQTSPRKHIIRVQPHQILHRPPGKGKIPGRRKIILPWDVIDFLRIFSPDLFCSVRRSGIRDNDLIHRFLHTLQTSFQHRFLIPYDHTKTDSDHICTFFYIKIWDRRIMP